MSDTTVFSFLLVAISIYGILLGCISWFYTHSADQRVAQENLPKTVKHITEGFVTIIVFLLLFYLAIKGIVPKDVLITLVSVFSTAGFLSLRNR